MEISIHKNLGSTTPSSYENNHSNGTSSLWLLYEGRNKYWDGNGGYIKTLYKYQGYATLISHASQGTGNNGDLRVWLRGGGCYYAISTTTSATVSVYYTETNLGTSTYIDNVAPRTDIGNGGIVTNALLGYGNIQGNATTSSSLASGNTINGTTFTGASPITTSYWGTARNFTIGNTTKSVNGSANVSWSLSEIGAVALNGSTHFISLTGGDGNTVGYRLIGQSAIGAWYNHRISFIVSSRHTGNGLVTISYGCNSSTISAANCYCNIRYFGISKGDKNGAISSDSFCAYVSSDGATMYFFWKYSDYNSTYITVLKNNGAFTISNGTWMTSIESSYGTAIATTCINMADSVFDTTTNQAITFNYGAQVYPLLLGLRLGTVMN